MGRSLLTHSGAVILTDLTAAKHWNLPLPPWIGLDPETPQSQAVSPREYRPREEGIRGRRMRIPRSDVLMHDGIEVTTPARTWVDCAEFLALPHLVAMGDALVRRGLATRDELRRATHSAFGRRGVAVARKALPLLNPRSESPGESLARIELVSRGLPEPECNIDIFDGDIWLARVDLCWRRERLIVEYDGAYHFTPEQTALDAARRQRLIDAGWTVLVVTAEDFKNTVAMCERVYAALVAGRR